MKPIKDQPVDGDRVLLSGADEAAVVRYAQLVGETGFVHAVDPQLAIYAQADPNENAAIWPWALGSRSGMARMSLPGGVRPVDDGPFPELHLSDAPGMTVELRTIDEMTSGWERWDFFDLDVNGFEPFVLAGGRKTIARLRPVIRVRVDPDKLAFYSMSPAAIASLLVVLGYKAYPRPRKADLSEPHDLICDPQ